MRGFYFIAAAAAAFLATEVAGASEPDKVERLDSVVVSASRAGKSTPVSYTMVGKKELRETNPMNSLPMTLALQPSVVISTEGGTGLGYSKMTVRGSKGSQINVTLNGITLNDAESQEVFWVNIPALSTFLSGVQVQRGLGTSACGAGAFGASINMNTAFVAADPSLRLDFSAGSYDTAVFSASASSGLLPSGLYFNVAYSANSTEGYIRNGWVDAHSLFAVLGWIRGNNSLRLTYLLGDQRSGITWNGVAFSKLATDRRSNSDGLYKNAAGEKVYYRNNSDNYRQQHIQLNWTHQFNPSLALSTTLNYTDGYGYNEKLKQGKKLTYVGFQKSFSYEGGVTGKSVGDMIYRKTMDNGLWVLNSELRYTGEKLSLTGGVYLSRHDGNHFGELMWSQVLGKDYPYRELNVQSPDNNWYFNNGLKQEANAFVRGEYNVNSWLTAYADVQYRLVDLDMSGIDDEDDLPMDFEHRWNFINPRAGLNAAFGPHRIYASVAYGNREPGRSDLKEIIESNNLEGGDRELRPERMLDYELGYGFTGKNFSAGANIYLMEYKDMLLETGELSRSGYAIKDNVDRSWRRGVEVYAEWRPFNTLELAGNATFSTNKIRDYVKYYGKYDNMDDWKLIGMVEEKIGDVDMLLSPSVIAMGRMAFTPLRNIGRGSLKSTTIDLSGKFVGSQYWDNTGSADRRIPSYFVADLGLSHEFRLKTGAIGLGFYVRNLLDREYYSDAWVYRAYFDAENEWYQEEGVFPQAPRNFMFRVSYSF